MQEMLHRIVKTSVDHLLYFVSRSFNVEPTLKLEEEPVIVVKKIMLRSTTSNSSISNYSDK
jgi:hypothetical protein